MTCTRLSISATWMVIYTIQRRHQQGGRGGEILLPCSRMNAPLLFATMCMQTAGRWASQTGTYRGDSCTPTVCSRTVAVTRICGDDLPRACSAAGVRRATNGSRCSGLWQSTTPTDGQLGHRHCLGETSKCGCRMTPGQSPTGLWPVITLRIPDSKR